MKGLQDKEIIEVFDEWAWLTDRPDKPGQNDFCPPPKADEGRTDTDNTL